MPDDLRFCALGCCHFVNSRLTTQCAYELAARGYLLGLNLAEPVRTMIPCRKAGGRINYAVERNLGFYIGLRLPRTTGIPVLEDKNPLVFDATSGDFLRIATDEDLRRWNMARRQALRILKAFNNGTLFLLQIPLGVPKF